MKTRVRWTVALGTLVLMTKFVFVTAAAAEQSPQQFTDSFVLQIEIKMPDLRVEVVDELHLSIIDADDIKTSMFLGNAYDLYRQDNSRLAFLLEQYTASIEESLTTELSTLKASRIVPIIKDNRWIVEMAASLRVSGVSDEPNYYSEPFAKGLTIFYAEDTPTNIRYLDKQALTDAEVDLGAIRKLAVNNLMRVIPDPEILGEDGLYVMIADGNYEVSLLLVDALWNESNFDVKGDFVVAIPARDTLIISGSEDVEQLTRLADLARDIHLESPYRLTTSLYVRGDNNWTFFSE